jgi:hypothetical protein
MQVPVVQLCRPARSIATNVATSATALARSDVRLITSFQSQPRQINLDYSGSVSYADQQPVLACSLIPISAHLTIRI